MKLRNTLLALLAIAGIALGGNGYGGRSGYATVASSGTGGTTTIYATNVPNWLASTQTLSGTNFPTTVNINPSNGCAVTLWATNALTANTAITITLPDDLQSNLLPITINCLCSNTEVTVYSTNIVPASATNGLLISGAGSTDANGTYYFTPANGIDGWPSYTNASIYVVELVPSSPPNWQIDVPNVADYYVATGDPTGPYSLGSTGAADPPTVAYVGTDAVTNITSVISTNLFSLVLPSSVWAEGGSLPALSNACEIINNRYILNWTGSHYEASKFVAPSSVNP